MQEINITTSKKQEIIDITNKVEAIISKSKVKEGICFIYVPHATAAIIINENADPNIQIDIINTINKIIPEHDNYLHDRIDNNAAAHIKSSIIGVSKTIPIHNGRLQLGRWQAIMFVELDGPRHNRRVIVSILNSE